ncbi:MAG: efflux RND transporter periplasmic adaptor subunit [Acidobacteria bacterium]|nr:efflux RND transporter periplasmic adaptor subunit [Acidobacteriota bacterium]
MNPLLKYSFLLSLLFVAACGKQAAKTAEAKSAVNTAPEVIAVKTAVAVERTAERSIAVTGTLLPDETVTVSAEVVGRIANIRADFGQAVRKGDILIELDRTEYDLQVERSRGALNQALARLSLPAYSGKIAPPDSTPGVRTALAQLEDAKFKYESAAKLVKSGDIAADRFNELEKAYNARQAAVDASRDELRTQWMSVTAMEADLKIAEKRRNDTIIRAPFDGVVGEKLISAGQFVKDNIGIIRLVKVHPMRLRLEVPEAATNAVRIGTQLSFTTDAALGVEFQAIVRELNPSLDARNRTLTAEGRLSKPDVRLRPGMFVQVKLVTEKGAKAVMVPRNALYSIAGLTKIFKIENGAARLITFTPGPDVDGLVEVPAGLIQSGDRVATSELGALTNGAKVRQ